MKPIVDPLGIHSGARPSSKDVLEHVMIIEAELRRRRAWMTAFQHVVQELSQIHDRLPTVARNDRVVDEMVEATKRWNADRGRTLVVQMRAIEALGRLPAEGRDCAAKLAALEREVYELTDSYNSLRAQYENKALADGIPIVGDLEEAFRAEVASLRSRALDEKMRVDIKVRRHHEQCEWWWGRCRVVAGKFTPDLADPAPHSTWGTGPNRRPIQASGGQLWSSTASIGPEDVVQQGIGDCWLAGTMASLTMTSQGRKLIQEMIADNGDGSFTVRFPAGPTVVVDGDVFVDSSGNPLGGTGHGGDYWFSILEKAYATAIPRSAGPKGSYSSLEGGTGEEVFKLLGLTPSYVKVKDASNQQVIDMLNNANRGLPTIAALPATVFGRGEGGHAVSVRRVESGPPPIVILRNPWGNNDQLAIDAGRKFGITHVVGSGGDFSMPLSRFMEFGIQVETATWPS